MKKVEKKSIRVVVPADVKAQAAEVLQAKGLSMNGVINDLLLYIATKKKVPFERVEKVVIK